MSNIIINTVLFSVFCKFRFHFSIPLIKRRKIFSKNIWKFEKEKERERESERYFCWEWRISKEVEDPVDRVEKHEAHWKYHPRIFVDDIHVFYLRHRHFQHRGSPPQCVHYLRFLLSGPPVPKSTSSAVSIIGSSPRNPKTRRKFPSGFFLWRSLPGRATGECGSVSDTWQRRHADILQLDDIRIGRTGEWGSRFTCWFRAENFLLLLRAFLDFRFLFRPCAPIGVIDGGVL